MLKFIYFLPLLLLGCSGPKKTFHYGDCVSIEDDFFGTRYGYLINKKADTYTVYMGLFQGSLETNSPYMTKVDDTYCEGQ